MQKMRDKISIKGATAGAVVSFGVLILVVNPSFLGLIAGTVAGGLIAGFVWKRVEDSVNGL